MGRIVAVLLATFPPPSVVPIDPSLKYDYGRVERVDGDRLVVVTVIGSVTFRAGEAVLIAPNGERHSAAELGRLVQPSTPVSLWYVLGPKGPAVRELQLDAPPEDEWRPFEGASLADGGSAGPAP